MALLFPALLLGVAQEKAVQLCIRWGESRTHVEDVLMLSKSGDSDRDDDIPDLVRSIDWPPPPAYQGEWVGYTMGTDTTALRRDDPECRDLPPPIVLGPGSGKPVD